MSKNDVEVIVIGGGLAGTSVYNELRAQGIDNVLGIEEGEIYRGSKYKFNGSNEPSSIRFSKGSQISYESDRITYIDNYGKKAADTYIELTIAGRNRQIENAERLEKRFGEKIVKKLGSLTVDKGELLEEIIEEYESYKDSKFSNELELLDIEKAAELSNLDKSKIDGGVFFKNDALINEEGYINNMLKEHGFVQYAEHRKVISYEDFDDGVEVTVENQKTGEKETITADKIVVATNGFMGDKNLKGKFDLNWNFCAAFQYEGKKDTPMSWTYDDEYYYWLVEDGKLFVGGKDISEKSRNKIEQGPEMESMEIKKIIDWVHGNFSGLEKAQPIDTHFGMLAKTKDERPIVGKFDNNSNIYYMTGCNGNGQSLFTEMAHIMPGIMGYRKLNKQEKRFAKFTEPIRKTL